MEKSEKALTQFRGGFNCAQSVLTAFAEDLGLSEKMALRVSGSFGAGMGRLQETCGAVTGAYMVLGLKYGQDTQGDTAAKEKAYGLTREFSRLFTEKHGSTCCRDLLGVDLLTPEGHQAFVDKELNPRVCQVCVASAAGILEQIL